MRGGGFGGSSGPPERSQQSGRWSVRACRRGGRFRGPERSRRAVPIRPEGPEHPERLLKTRAGSVEKEPAGGPFEGASPGSCPAGGRREAGGSPFGGEPGAAGNGPAGCPFGARIRKMFRSGSGRGRFRMRAGSRTFKNMLENNKQ